jgi:DNA invertase Pin-like site-specific DNA recombinase
MADARCGLFDVVVVWRFDRFARSVKELVLALEEFRSLGIDFISRQEAIDSSTPMGRAMFTIIASIAELEQDIIRERVVAGLEYAHTNGTRSGKPRPREISGMIRYSTSGIRRCRGDRLRKYVVCAGHYGPPRLPVDGRQT